MTDISSQQTSSYVPPFAPFLIVLLIPVFIVIGAMNGGWFLVLAPFYAWFCISFVDAIIGKNIQNADPETSESKINLHRWLTILWTPLQICLVFGLLMYLTQTGHLSTREEIILMVTLGIATGGIGINYSHELMHQKPKIERWAADISLAMVLYSHFRSEHLLVHHRYIGTPRDPVTAKYNEGFHRFFPRVLVGCFKSAWGAEAAMLTRKKLPATDISNPFWRYGALQLVFLIAAFLIGGWYGICLFIVQAFVAILHLELVNYVEHYGLTRKHLGDGKYEHVKPHHSWNTDFSATNFLLINLQRHSDHHYKPDRRFPLLQTYSEDEAPQLPVGYPLMTLLATIPPAFKRVMNHRVKAWRKQHYPEISDWHAYNKALNPKPR